jgi:4-carboxymuconolactone decarboxylase
LQVLDHAGETAMQNVTEPRIKAVDPLAMTSEQSAAAAVVAAGPRGSVRGPFAVLLNSPGAFAATQGLGAYLRFESAIPDNLRELAILATARHWRQDYEWSVHAALAVAAGVSARAIAALAAGDTVAELTPDEAVVLHFCQQLHRSGGIDDAIYAQAEQLLGVVGVIDLCAVCGYYALLAMAMNVARNPLPATPSPFAE